MSDLLSFLTLLISASCEAQEILYFQAGNTSISRDQKHGLYFAKFVKHQFKYLSVTPLLSSVMSNEKKCLMGCVQNLQCLSLNVAVFPQSDGKFQCELLATDIFNSSSSFIDNVNFKHYSLKTECHDQPCENNGRCVADYKTNTYSCQCQCPYYGYNCEKVLAQIWSAWSADCSFHHRCPDYAKKRVKTYALPEPPFDANVCPNNTVLDTEIQNCPGVSHAGCEGALGMQDGRIPNSQITASSYIEAFYAPWYARLHRTVTSTDEACWAPATKNIGEYLQIDLGSVKTVTKVATQGKISHFQFVTKYSVKYSVNNVDWLAYPELPCIKEFPGNADQNTVVTNVLDQPIRARYVRIVVKAFHDYPILRCEIYGC